MPVERLEAVISIKNETKPWLENVRDDIKWFNKRIESDTAIELSMNIAKIQTQINNVKEEIKKAKQAWDLEAEVKLTADTERLKQ